MLMCCAVVVVIAIVTNCSRQDPTTEGSPISEAAAASATTPQSSPPPTSLPPTTTRPETSADVAVPSPVATPLRVGAEVLVDSGFAALHGKRVGAIVNQTSLVDGHRLIDALADDAEVALLRLFAPEHGIDGSLAAGEVLDDSTDRDTGLPIVSLYGSTRQPTNAMFDDLDVVVFDLQDVGSRSYTYISTMGLAMQTAAATGTAFIVLDRPNPAGSQMNGLILAPAQQSFIGLYPLPAIHGMTVGEIATAMVAEGWLPGLDGLDLTVVPIEGWTRDQRWDQIGRDWVPPSPRLPTADIALLYTGMAHLAGTSISDGSGTATPFALAGAPFIASADDFAATLQAAGIPGVRVEATTFTPEPIVGVSPAPLHQGVLLEGARFVITDHEQFSPLQTALAVLVACQDMMAPGDSVITDPASFDLVAGAPDLRHWIEAGESVHTILERMRPDIDDFQYRYTAWTIYD